MEKVYRKKDIDWVATFFANAPLINIGICLVLYTKWMLEAVTGLILYPTMLKLPFVIIIAYSALKMFAMCPMQTYIVLLNKNRK